MWGCRWKFERVGDWRQFGLRYRSLSLFVPASRCVSSAYRRVRRVVAPAGESLSFVASNESNQSKDALHFAIPLRTLPSATCLPSLPSDHGTPVSKYPTTCLATHRHDGRVGLLRTIAPRRSEAWTGKVAKQRPYCSWAPWEASRSAGIWGRVRSTLRHLTSRGCLSAAAAGREASSARGPKHRAPQSSPARAGPPPSGPPFFGDFLSGKRKKVTALSGAFPDAASRSEQTQRKSRTRLRSAQRTLS